MAKPPEVFFFNSSSANIIKPLHKCVEGELWPSFPTDALRTRYRLDPPYSFAEKMQRGWFTSPRIVVLLATSSEVLRDWNVIEGKDSRVGVLIIDMGLTESNLLPQRAQELHACEYIWRGGETDPSTNFEENLRLKIRKLYADVRP